MHDRLSEQEECAARRPIAFRRKERGVQLVVLLTAVMMVVEIAVGYTTNSMALLADGWHMATHVGALGLASVAYALSRRYAAHPAFAFGTGKVHALSGYTSAVALGLVALVMIAESCGRLIDPHAIDFARSLPVAVIGLVVNVASVLLLHVHEDHEEHHQQDEHHDHNHRAAFLHVVADTLTSGLAILALLGGRFLGWGWLDAVSGIVGGLMILKWGLGLSRAAAFELLDVDPSSTLTQDIRAALEALDDVRVRDLHVWSIGRGAKSCVVTVVTSEPCEVDRYRKQLAAFHLAHLTIEVQRCSSGPHRLQQSSLHRSSN